MDLKKCNVTFEFGLVPRYPFASDGSVLLVYDKATIFHHLEKDAASQDIETEAGNQTISSRVIVLHGMAWTNSVSTADNMKTGHDFAESIIEKLINLVSNYDEVRLVLDKYLNTSKNN